MPDTIWDELGIAPTTDERAIKRAYAARVKITSPEADPAGYMKLRAAYDQAKQHARVQQQLAELEDQEEERDAGAAGETPDPPPVDSAAPAATPQQLAISELHAALVKRDLEGFLRKLEEIKAAETFASLDDQYHFTGSVAVMVQEAIIEDTQWLGRLAQALGAREHENPFDGDGRYWYAYDSLLEQYGKMRADDAQAHLEDRPDDSAAQGYLHVYHVLTAPFDAERLSALTRSQSYHRLAERLLERAKTDPGIAIPAENREWWERTAMAGQHRPVEDAIGEHVPQRQPQAEGSSGGFPVWTITVILLMLVNAVRMCTSTPTHTSSNVDKLEEFRREMPMIIEREVATMPGFDDLSPRLASCDAQTRREIMMHLFSRRFPARTTAAGTPPPAPPAEDPKVIALLEKCAAAPAS